MIIKILFVLALLVLSFFISVYIGTKHTQEGGTYNFYGSSTNYQFIVKDSDINSQGYYIPKGMFSFWKIQTNPVSCGGNITYCACGGLEDPDANSTYKYGWPLFYAYDHGTCGTLNVYLPVPFIIDYLTFVVGFGLISLFIIKTIKYKNLRQ